MDERPINLESLQQTTPPAGLWAAIDADLERRRRRGKPWATSVPTLAIAAAVVAVVLLVRVMDAPPAPEMSPMPHRGELVELQARAAELGAELVERRSVVIDAAALESLIWLETEIGWLDEQLSEAPHDTRLWRERVDLLEEMNRRYAGQDWRHQLVWTGI